MDFPKILVTLRKEKKLTQQKLADIVVGVHVIQIRRYESGSAQPTLEVIKKLAIALSVSADKLILEIMDGVRMKILGFNLKPSLNSILKKNR